MSVPSKPKPIRFLDGPSSTSTKNSYEGVPLIELEGRPNISEPSQQRNVEHLPSDEGGLCFTSSSGTVLVERAPPTSTKHHLSPKPFSRDRGLYSRRCMRLLKHLAIFWGQSLFICLMVAVPVTLLRRYSIEIPHTLTVGHWDIPLYSCQEQERGYLNHGAWIWTGIDVAFGQLSYSQAKMADLAFNWVAGRGFTALFAYLTYRVSLEAILRVAEIHYVSYETFTTLALYSTKIDTLLQLIRGFLRCPGWRPRLMMTWLFLTTIYLAALPALFDIMTGYDSFIQTALVLPGNESIKITTEFINEVESYGYQDSSLNYTNNYFAATIYNYHTLYTYHWFDETLDLSWNKYYNTSVVAEYEVLPDPYTYTQTNASRAHRRLVRDKYNAMVFDSRKFYMSDQRNYVCVSIPNVYQWGLGVSSLSLIVLLWCLTLSRDAEHNSQICRKRRTMGKWRTILDISESLREHLGPDHGAHSEKELEDAISRLDPIKYCTSGVEVGKITQIGLSSRRTMKLRLQWDEKYR
ncbi:MAG: hypothetical protein Q9187_003384 [Circinaria calcarea]